MISKKWKSSGLNNHLLSSLFFCSRPATSILYPILRPQSGCGSSSPQARATGRCGRSPRLCGLRSSKCIQSPLPDSVLASHKAQRQLHPPSLCLYNPANTDIPSRPCLRFSPASAFLLASVGACLRHLPPSLHSASVTPVPILFTICTQKPRQPQTMYLICTRVVSVRGHTKYSQKITESKLSTPTTAGFQNSPEAGITSFSFWCFLYSLLQSSFSIRP